MDGITLDLLERRICEINGAMNEVQTFKNYLLDQKAKEEKAQAEAAKKAEAETSPTETEEAKIGGNYGASH